MKQQTSFIYPILNKNVVPAKNIGDFYVTVIAETGVDGNLKIEIKRITHFPKGEGFGSNITDLLEYINHKLYMEVFEAAKNHVNSVIAAMENTEEQ